MDFTEFLKRILMRAGKQETVANELGLSPSSLSKRLSGEVGWSEKELNKLLEYGNFVIEDKDECRKQISVLKEAMKILLK